MAEAAVAEAPVTTETKGEPHAEETKDLRVTDLSGEQQTAEAENDAPDSKSEPESAEEHAAKLETERKAADEALRAEEIKKAAIDLKAQEEREAAQKARKEQISTARTTAVTDAANVAKGINDLLESYEVTNPETGKPFRINEKRLTNIVEKLNLAVEESVRGEVADEYQTAFNDRLGDQSDAFWEEANKLAEEDGMIPVAALLDLYAERKAPSTKAIKDMSLEDFAKASPKARKELADKLKSEFDRGREDPMPPGEPASTGRTVKRGPLSADDVRSLSPQQVADMLADPEKSEWLHAGMRAL